MKENSKRRHLSNKTLTIVFGAIICVPLLAVAVYFIGGLYVIAHGDDLYAKELNNPYVNANFEGWHTKTIDQFAVALPNEWNFTTEDGFIRILQEEKCVATGALIKENSLFSTKEEFLSQVLSTDVFSARCDVSHSLLLGNFGKLYINESEVFKGYYLSLSDSDDGTKLFLYFSADQHIESELQSKAEAIIYSHKYPVKNQSTDSSVIDGQKTFDMADYQNEIGFFASDKNVGPITDEETAIEKAKVLWREEFGSVNGEPYDPIKDKKIEAFFDSKNDCWLIKTLPPEPEEESGGYIKITLGGGLYAIIQNDGAVVAVWFED